MQLNISATLLRGLIALGDEVAISESRALNQYKREGALDCALSCAKSLREMKRTLREARRIFSFSELNDKNTGQTEQK